MPSIGISFRLRHGYRFAGIVRIFGDMQEHMDDADKRNETAMIDQELLDILACPETKEPVRLAEQSLVDSLNAQIERGEITNRSGAKVEKTMDGGLIREDGKYLYPVEDEIPIMLIDEAIPLEGITA